MDSCMSTEVDPIRIVTKMPLRAWFQVVHGIARKSHISGVRLSSFFEAVFRHRGRTSLTRSGTTGYCTELLRSAGDLERMAVVVSLINMKGGVGKTTVASQLAHAAAADGRRVLAIDLDPQSNLSHSILGPKPYVRHLSANGPTVVQILEDYIPPGGDEGGPRRIDVNDVILRGVGYGRKSSLDLIASRLELSRTLKNPTGKERRLARGIGQVADQYELVVIDCAPTESILTDAAYFASRYVVVPVKPEFMATIGLPLLARSVREFRLENEDHELEIAGLVINDQSEYADNREKGASIAEVQDVADQHGWRIFDYQIPYSRSYAKAARNGLPLARTKDARWDRIIGFRSLKDDILAAVGVT